MIRLVVETKLILDLSKLSIFVSSNPVSDDVKSSVMQMLHFKPMYIGTYSSLRYIVKMQYNAGVLVVALGELLLGCDAARYVHLEEMFRIAHRIYHDCVKTKVDIVSAIVAEGEVK